MGPHFDFLRRVYFFRNLNDKEIELIESLCHEERYAPGEILFVEGSKADRFFIISSGRVEVWKNFYEKEPDLLAVHGPGHFFGEMALIDDLPRSATVVAREDSLVIYIFREDFHRLVKDHSAIALSVMTSISFLVRSSNEVYVDDLSKRNEALKLAYRELERAQEDRLKSERFSNLGKFSSLILHDIRNPLSILKGQLQLMDIHAQEPDKLRHNISNALTEVDRMERMAGEFLDYTRGDIRLNMAVVIPKTFMEKIVEKIHVPFERSHITINCEVDCEEPAILDADRISRVLLNIADNARKAMTPGGTFTIRIRANDGNLVFEMEDNGEGMSPETLSHLFEPFFSMSKQGGTGLGMLIAKNITESHGGTIQVKSAEGSGTTITLSLPLRT